MTDNIVQFPSRSHRDEPIPPREKPDYDTQQLLAEFGQLVLCELVEKTPDHEKLFWILQHGRTCRLIRSTGGASFSKHMTRDPKGQPWEFDVTELAETVIEAGRENFPGHLPERT